MSLTQEKIDIAQATAKKLKDFGFQVFLPEVEFPTYGYYSDGDFMAYFQAGDFAEGIYLVTSHLPNRQSGTGFRIFSHLTTETLSKKDALITLRCTAPDWASDKDLDSVVKTTLTRFLEKEKGFLKQ